MSDAREVMERCDILAVCSDEPDRITRPFASDAMRRAHRYVREWMRQAGMTVTHDNVGNLCGHYDGTGPGILLLGSHLDSVRDAGKYDGPLGVMVAIAAVQRLNDAGRRLPLGIEVLAFADEEGLRFGTTYLGSHAVAGGFDGADLERRDPSGTTMAEAIRAFGGDPARIAEDRWQAGRPVAYCEVHIEQGPVLEARALPLGVVSAIVGQSRFEIVLTGVAGHAGTVPMERRRDALTAAAELVLAAEAAATTQDGLVATVGRLDVDPNVSNVIPGRVTLSLDVRHADDRIRYDASEALLGRAREIASRRRVGLEIRSISENAAVRCAPRLTSLLARAITDSGHQAIELTSGAGHDAVVMASLTDVGMLFVRCKGGVSHHPAESVTEADVAVALDVLGRFLELL